MSGSSEKKEEESEAAKVPPEPPEKPEAHREKPEAEESLGRRLLTDFLITGLVLFLVTVWIEPSPLGRQLAQTCYKDTVLSWTEPSDVPVQLVDLKNIPPVNGVTPRGPLLALLTSLAQMEPKPAAIGVDVDFSMRNDGDYVDSKHDPQFFRACLALEKANNVPIYLGIRRSQYQSPTRWLGDEEFQSLAASGWIDRRDIGRLPYCLKTRSTPFGTSLSAALASAYLFRRDNEDPKAGLPPLLSFPPAPGVSNSLAWAVQRYQTVRPDDDRVIHATEFLVDYSPIKNLMDQAFTASKTAPGDVSGLNEQSCRNKVILLGDTRPPEDFFTLPGFEYSAFPGIYMQACACCTLIDRPLVELRWPGRVAVDLLFTGLVAGALAGVRWGYRTRRWEINAPRLHNLVTGAVCIVIVLFAGLAARGLHVLWDDYLFVVIGLYLHGLIGDVIEEVAARREPRKSEAS